MKLIGLQRLQEFAAGHSDIKSALDAWIKEVQDANRKTTKDIKQRYSSASFLRANNVVFNIRGNSYRLHVTVAYNTGVVLVKRIGTHAEYDKWEF